MFPGQYFDAETGLHQNYFRDYDPRTGRYIEPDPIGLKGGLNLYVYAADNPLTFIDPNALLSCTYEIASHRLSCSNNAGQLMQTTAAASGRGDCQNDPECTPRKDKGPLPLGNYWIHPPGYSPNRPTWLYLRPLPGNKMGPRGGFFIHPWGISNGCIMLHLPNFQLITEWATQDGGGDLVVVR